MAAQRVGSLDRLGKLLAGVACIWALLGSAEAWARPAVTLADFNDATRGPGRAEKVRSAIVKALQDADEVEIIPWARVKSLAASRRVKTVDLAKPRVAGKVLQSAGGDALVTAFIARSGGQIRMSLHIYDVQGAEIWEKTVPLANGELKATTAQRFAAAIAASVGVVGGEKPVPRAAETAPESPPEPKVAAEPAPEPEARPSANDEPEMPLTAVPERSRRPRPSRAEPAAEEEPEKRAEEPEDDLARPGWVSLTADLTFTWRDYRFCPEVTDCGQASPSSAGMAPVKYSTGAPYSGVLVRAELYPLRFLDNFVRGLGLSFAYGSSLGLKTHYTEDSVEQVFGSRQQRLQAELLYRFYFRIGGVGDGWAGLRGGWMQHAFFVDENPKIVESVRSGLYGQLDLAVPLHRFLRIEAKGTLIPYAGPGKTERALYGEGDPDNDRPTQGGGWAVEGGLTSDLGHPDWHVGLQAMFEYTRFGDRYNNPVDTHPEFGRATESYLGFRVGLKAQL